MLSLLKDAALLSERASRSVQVDRVSGEAFIVVDRPKHPHPHCRVVAVFSGAGADRRAREELEVWRGFFRFQAAERRGTLSPEGVETKRRLDAGESLRAVFACER